MAESCRVVWNDPESVIRFVAERTDEKTYTQAVGIGYERNGRMVAGVVYQNKAGANILMHVASDGSRRWLRPEFLAAAFRYPFIQERCERVTGLVRADNYGAQRFDEHLGFTREGLMRRACDDGCDLIVYGMLKSECRFLEGKYLHALRKSLGHS